MNCSKCGFTNSLNSKFCIKCGNSLAVQASTNIPSTDNQANIYNNNLNQTMNDRVIQITPEQQNCQQPNNTIPNQQINNVYNSATTINNSVNNVQNNSISFSGYFYLILAVILKPFTALKEELNKLSNFKNSIVLTLIISVIATIFSLIKTMISTVRVTSVWSDKTTWVWENLKEINYFQIVFKNLLIYLGVIVVVAGLYYLAGLVLKKQVNYSRLLGISALAVTPLIISILILSPLLTMIYEPIGMGITIIGTVYTILILYEGINGEIMLEGNAKYYFNLICFSILGVAMYYLYLKLFMSSISSGLGDLINLFN